MTPTWHRQFQGDIDSNPRNNWWLFLENTSAFRRVDEVGRIQINAAQSQNVWHVREYHVLLVIDFALPAHAEEAR